MVAATAINEQVLDAKLTDLEKARQWNPRVVSKLETFIRTAEDRDLFRINPLTYAAERGMSEAEGIDLFLYGVKVGLFEMEWFMICSSCGRIVYSLRSMARLHSHFVCSCCSMHNEAMLDDFIQVAFTISPTVRQIRYHTPDSLDALDFIQASFVHPGAVAAPYFGGISYGEFFQQQNRLIDYIQPGETRMVNFEAAPGVIVGIDTRHDTGFNMLVSPDAPPAEQAQAYRVRLIDGRMEGVDPLLTAQPVNIADKQFSFNECGFAAVGPMQVEIENTMPEHSAMLIMQIPGTPEGIPTIRFVNPLSGKRLLSHQTFRELFRSEVVQSDEGLGVRDITFMFTDLKGSTALYDQIGDAKAYYLVRQHFETLGRVITQHNGAVVKTIGDAVMATFVDPKDAAAAALGMLAEIEAFNQGISEQLILKIGVHRGHSIVVTLNDRLDYFGQTVNIASRVQGLADAGEIYVSDEVYQSAGVKDLLTNKAGVEAQDATLKGVGERIRVYRVTTAG